MCPQNHHNIRISATLRCWTCSLFVGQHSAPYNIAGRIAVLLMKPSSKKNYEASQQHHLEVCDMKCQIKNLEEERSKLQEENSRLQKQLQTAQACKHSIFCLDFALSYQFLRYLPIRFSGRPYSTNSSRSSPCRCG